MKWGRGVALLNFSTSSLLNFNKIKRKGKKQQSSAFAENSYGG